jgi:peptide/nickel transport system permease protein
MAFLRKIQRSDFVYYFFRDPIAYISFGILLVLFVGAFAAPLIAPHNPYDPTTIDIMDSELPPAWTSEGSARFLLGTDDMGRDMLSTMLYGMRISILIGLGAVLLQATIGIVVGLLSGYIKKLDAILMRIADVQLSFSTYMIAIFIGATFQMMFGVANYEKIAAPLLILIIGLAEWPQYARTVRASVLAERQKEYIEAARIIGLSRLRIMWRHILPNTLSPVLVLSTVQVANAIMSEAALSFLGLGMPQNKPSLGSLITSGFEYIFSGTWWITIFPGILLVVLILVVNLLGDWIRDYLNPKLYKG